MGIAALTAFLVRGSQTHQDYLAAHVTAGSPASYAAIQRLGARFVTLGAGPTTAHHQALGALYANMQQQAAVLAYADNFRLMGYLSLACIPLVWLLARPEHGTEGYSGAAGE